MTRKWLKIETLFASVQKRYKLSLFSGKQNFFLTPQRSSN